ncbi:hypothetical protein KIN20_003857 [Parelaphostrongylus tenuis]|uniref:Uncharacterized protein n=1 Tax=Parelaphostrongylus tenuis TaxID=148309 RepID=A0AAD5QGF9_PARTN|nr:hypothetical protein KIN20_003857 [Parelaphostrongylus tenuis]
MGLVRTYNTGDIKSTTDMEDFVVWVRKRLKLIDSETGLIEHCISLLNSCVQRGYEELKSDLECFIHYKFFVTTCYLVGETFDKFYEASPDHCASLLSKLPEEDIVRNLSEILSLLRWKTRHSFTAADDLRKNCAIKQSSIVLDRDIVIQCLCCSELTGDALMRAVVSVGVCPDLASSLSTFHSRGVKPTFKQLWESTTDADSARRLLIRMARCGQAESVAEWEALRDEVLDLTSSIYSELITSDEAIGIVTREVLSDPRISHDRNVLKLFLTLDKNDRSSNVGRRLNIEKSAEVLITKSEELLQEAQSPSDPVLRQSRRMAEVAKGITPVRATKQLKLLDIVNLAHELGSTALPVAIKFAEPYAFLEEIVKLNGNYKQRPPLSLCALSALVANDERYLGRYIHEVMTKGHDLPVVHELCIRIMESPFIPAVMEEIYACALLNCPDDKLMETLDLIERHSSARKRRFSQELTVNDKLVIDPMYDRSATWTNQTEADEAESIQTLREFSDIPTNAVATLLANISAPLALCVAMSREDCELWTKNDFLLKYEQALRFFEPQLTEHLVECVPPSVLISQATLSDENATILDRLSHYGCDRERFVEDADYRTETIMGLAMTDDDAIWADAIRLAADFKLDDWPVHFASLENALTSLSISEAKTLLKSRKHLARLRSDPDRLYRQLRSSVAPLMASNEQFIAYLTLFSDEEPERASLPVIKRILEKRRDVKAFRLFTDANYLCNIIISMPDRVILSVEKELRCIPVGVTYLKPMLNSNFLSRKKGTFFFRSEQKHVRQLHEFFLMGMTYDRLLILQLYLRCLTGTRQTSSTLLLLKICLRS